jgi:multiple sugar transport system substrate-binding protein
MAGEQAQLILATQYSEIPARFSVREDPAAIKANPVLRAAASTRLVSRPSAILDYQVISKAIHSNIYAALPGQSSGGTDPCTALVKAARAIDRRVRGTLRCGSSGASRG